MAGRLLTPEEVAERLSVSPKTVRDWLRCGSMKGCRIGGKGLWRVREADLEYFLQDEVGYKTAPRDDAEDIEWLEAEIEAPLPSYDWGPVVHPL
ncbi:MAG: helix-turn-helix domain-containing protein [Bacillota bacterium]|jgi:excisionase family DNA binding protein